MVTLRPQLPQEARTSSGAGRCPLGHPSPCWSAGHSLPSGTERGGSGGPCHGQGSLGHAGLSALPAAPAGPAPGAGPGPARHATADWLMASSRPPGHRAGLGGASCLSGWTCPVTPSDPRWVNGSVQVHISSCAHWKQQMSGNARVKINCLFIVSRHFKDQIGSFENNV